MRDYRKIDAWKLADDLTVVIYERTRRFPKEEIYGLTAQLRRAAYSVAANIAEGSARDSQKDYLHFLYIARGSLSETQYFLHHSWRLDYITETEHNSLAERVRAVFACMHGLIKAVEKESGKVAKVVAATTSALFLCLTKLLPALVTSP
jgi:four helix bundle protein